MARTGAVEGIHKGRLKQWLHRIQVEENLTFPDGNSEGVRVDFRLNTVRRTIGPPEFPLDSPASN